MESVLKYLAIIFLILIIGCKSTSTTTERTHFVSDTLYTIETQVVQLPIKNITIIESPCKDSVLIPVNQTLKVGNTVVTLSNQDGDLIAEIEQKADTLTSTDTTQIHNETQTESIKETVIRIKVPKWAWYSLGINLVLLIWIFKKPLLRLIKPI